MTTEPDNGRAGAAERRIEAELMGQGGQETSRSAVPDGREFEDTVGDVVAACLKIPSDRFDTLSPLSRFGVDSIIVTEIMKRLSDMLGVSIAPTVFFEAKNAKELAQILDGRYRREADRVPQSQKAPQNPLALPDRRAEKRAPKETSRTVPASRSKKAASWIASAKAALAQPGQFRTDQEDMGAVETPHVSGSAFEPIAVLAMDGRFAQSADLGELQSHLEQGDDCITEIPAERWDWRQIYDDPGKGEFTKVKYGGVAPAVDQFDPLYFGLSPREAELMDPQHRLFIQSAYRLLGEAGYAPSSIAGRPVGVFIGVNLQDYAHMIDRAGSIEALHLTSLGHMFCPNRLSFMLDITGPSQVIDTACSSSLIAVHRAVLALQHEGCEMAIAGGANLMLTPDMHIMYSKVGMLCEDGRCKTFSARANGYVRGDGVGAVLLKPLSAAERDGDTILAVIRGSSENHGGQSTSLTAPNPLAQARLIAEAHGHAGGDPRRVGYIECHGTGTELGDPIEINGLKQAFTSLYDALGKTPEGAPHCGLGSIKSNIGHAETAAGIAGLIKAVIGLRSGRYFPTLHSEDQNPLISLEQTPFFISRKGSDWPRPVLDGQTFPRRAGVSSFGAGGSNAHVVVEEYLPETRTAAVGRPDRPMLIPLSARTEAQLDQVILDLLAHLEGFAGDELPSLEQIAYTLQTGRDPMAFRLAFVADTVGSLVASLRRLRDGDQAGFAKGCVKTRRRSREETTPADLSQPLPDLAEAWVSGALLDWSALHENRPAKVRLPAYPFEKRRCWIPAPAGEMPLRRRSSAVFRKKSGFGLAAHKNEPGEGRYDLTLTGAERFLKDHVVVGVPMLPGAAYLEIARAAAAQFLDVSHREAWRFDKIVWVQPCTVTEGSTDLTVHCTGRPDGSVEFRITSMPGSQLHCQGVVRPGETGNGSGQTVPATEPANTTAPVLDKAQCYNRFSELGLSYGPSHRGLQQIWRGPDGEAYAEINRPDEADDQGFLLDPAMLDCVLQSCLGLAEKDTDSSASLPFELGTLELFGTVPDQLRVCVRVGPQNTRLPRIDLDVTGPDGRLVMRLQGFANRELDPALGQETSNDTVLRARPVWHPVTPGAATPSAVRQLVCGMAHGHSGAGETARVVHVSGNAVADYLRAAKTIFSDFKAAVTLGEGTGFLQIVVPQSDEAYGTAGLFSGLAGLVATANKESTRLQAQLVECPGDLAALELPALLSQAARVTGASHLRLSSKGILARGWEKLKVEGEGSPWRNDGIYLITGGTGGLGQRFAERIAQETSAATVILAARSTADADLVVRLQDLGLKVDSTSCDLGDPDAVQAMVRSVVARHGRIDGILHAAGVLKDGFIADKAEADFDLVGRAKLAGTWALDQASVDLPLDFFATFGSASAVWGSAGQTDYAAANGFLEAFALWRSRKAAQGERFGVSLNIAWPPWQDGGMRMAPEALARMQESTGLGVLATAAGIDEFEAALLSGGPQQVVMCGTQLAIDDILTPPAAPVSAQPVSQRTESDGLQLAAEELLLEHIAEHMGFERQDLDAESEWSDLGFDSITMTTFSNRLNEAHGMDLTPTVFFEYVTIADMAGFLAQTYESCLSGLLPENPVRHTAKITEKPLPDQPDPTSPPDAEAIAIIGMAGRFPDAPDLETFWENLRSGRACLREIPEDRWDWRALKAAGLTDVNRAGFIDGIAEFDARHFGISRREAALMDPAQRLLMEYVWRAIEDAGYAPSSLAGSDTAVIIGTAPSGYGARMAENGIGIDSHSSTGSVGSVGPNRISYLLDLHGPSEPVETACSSALVALHRAISAMRAGDCSQAIVGGVNLVLSPETHISFSKAGMLSPDGRCKTFSAQADGYGRGEGVGMLFLKPLTAAERDGDFVHGIILGSAENHGGKANSLTAPNPRAQAALVETAVRRAGIAPQSLSYMEAHGTGTELGDPIEIEGLKTAFDALEAGQEARCAIGSVKTNIGHLELAAGVAGVLKVLLQMRNRTLAPSLPEEVNPYLKLKDSPFYLVPQAQEWRRPVDAVGKEIPRRAGVSSFGFGGVNAHVVLEEPAQTIRADMPEIPELIVLSARDREGLAASADALAKALTPYANTGGALEPTIESRLCACLADILEIDIDEVEPLTKLDDLGVEPVHRPLLRRSVEKVLGLTIDHDLVHRAGSIREISSAFQSLPEHSGMEAAPLLRDIAFTLRAGRDAMTERVAFAAQSLKELVDRLRILAATRDNLTGQDGFWHGRVPYKTRRHNKVTQSPKDVPLEELARLWVGGAAYDWEAERDGRDLRRVPLPGTSFKKERIWFDTLNGKPSAAVPQIKDTSLPSGMALTRKSDGVFEVSLSGDEFFLRDHIVQGQPVLPGVAYLELARSAGCLHLQSRDLALKDVVWVQPAVISEPQTLQVVLGSPGPGQEYPFRILSHGDSGERLHCRGAIAHLPEVPPEIINNDAIPSGRRIPSNEIYSLFETAGLHYGPGHQCLNWLVSDGSRVVADLSLPEICGSAVEPFVLHPSLMDGALQAAIGFGLAGEEQSGDLALPFAIESLQCLTANKSRMRVHLERRSVASAAHGIEKIDIALCDESGQVLTRINGFSTRRVALPEAGKTPAHQALGAQDPVNVPAQDGLKDAAAAYFKRLLSEALACPPDEIDLDEPLEYYGFDSHMVMELTAVLEKEFGTLSKTLFFEHQTLGAVLDHFIEAHGPSLTTVVRKGRGAAGTPASVDAAAKPRTEPKTGGLDIAVIGLAGRYPQAYDIAGFWDNLRNGRDGITEVPADRWKWQDYFSTDRSRIDAHFSKWGGFIDDVAAFDPLFFNISPGMAEAMDPQERLFLEHAWTAMEDAGYRPGDLQAQSVDEDGLPGQVGVYAGVMYGEYQLLGLQGSLAGEPMSTASYYAGVANRVSYALNLHGPSMAVDTMCSSSLTAIHLACADLALGRVRMAFAGGVNLNLHPNKYSLLSKGQFISSNGRCQSFGSEGDGYVPAEGVGVVLLKRLADAEADGDHIYGVIKGSALNHGGRANGYTVPNPEAQHHVIARALREAGVDPRAIGYVEAHGTGTKLGDPIEIKGLNDGYGPVLEGPCWIGSAKSNIGHGEAVSGLAGLTKVLLQLKAGEIAPSLHAETLNPNIDFAATPFRVNTSLRTWDAPVHEGKTLPRVSAVSSFGAGGSNAHLVVEEHCPPPSVEPYSYGPVLITLSAKAEDRLKAYACALADWAENAPAETSLRDLAYTLQVGREPMPHRIGVQVSTVEELARYLRQFLAGRDGPVRSGRARVVSNPTVENPDGLAAEVLLDGWMQGTVYDWRKIYGGEARRLSLPTYPFAREIYWPDTTAQPAPIALRTAATTAKTTETRALEAKSTGHTSVLHTDLLLLRPQWKDLPLTAPSIDPALRRVAHIGPMRNLQEHAQLALPASDPADPNTFTDQALALLRDLKELALQSSDQKVHYQVVLPASYSQSAALAGMLDSAARELPRLTCQVLCFDTDDPASGPLEADLKAVAAWPGKSRLRKKDGRWQALTWQEEQDVADAQPGGGWREGGRYLIVGGCGGLGAIVARHLAQTLSRVSLVLTGRSPSGPKQNALLQELRSKGAHADYLATDLGDAAAVRSMIRQTTDQGSLHGVIHCGGVLSDALILRKTEEDLRRVFAPKVTGVANLDRATDGLDLDLFLVFSSIAGTMGNPGQADYAAANAYLDQYVEERNRRALSPGGPRGMALSVAWPYWADGGMTLDAAAVNAMRDGAGLVPLSTARGLEALDRIVRAGWPQTMVLEGDGDRLAALIAAADAGQPAGAPAGPEPAPPPSSFHLQDAVEEYLAEELAKVLRISPQRLEADVPLVDYGVDSVAIMALTASIETVTGPLPATLFFENPTIEAAAGALTDLASQSLMEALHVPEPTVDLLEPAPGGTAEDQAPSEDPLLDNNAKPVRAEAAVPDTQSAGSGDIAIIAMEGRFPGAEDLEEFWDNLVNGRNSITEVPKDRWDAESLFDPDGAYEGKARCKWGGFLSDVDGFDARFFRITPDEAELLDPQERLFLETAWALMEKAGYMGPALRVDLESAVGVFAGSMTQQYHAVRSDPLREALTVLSSPSSIANRVSNVLDLNGPSLAVDTMCSSGIVAIHMACESLRAGACRAAIAGGVNVSIHPKKYIGLSASQFIGSRRDSTSFRDGDGYLPAEGVGAVLLRPLDDAVAAGDRVLALIKSTGINHSGRSNGYRVPSVAAQAKLIGDTIRQAGVPVNTITYAEAAANGAAMGDSIELAAFRQAFQDLTPEQKFCAIGSVKSNIGHAESASGLSQLAKVVLQMQAETLVPTLGTDALNPKLDFSSGPFRLQSELQAWARPIGSDAASGGSNQPLRAILNSVGAGGTNACMVLEEPPKTSAPPAAVAQDQYLIPLSARDEADLRVLAGRLKTYLETRPETRMADLALTLQTGRSQLDQRAAMISRDVPALLHQLEALAEGLEADGLVTGNTMTGQDALSGLLTGKTGAEIVSLLLRHRNLRKLAVAWVHGARLNWSPLQAEGAQRLALPAYPFRRTRYWLGGIDAREAVSQLEPDTRSDTTDPETCIRDYLINDLRIAPEEIDFRRSALDHGLNSVMLMPLCQALEARCGLTVGLGDIMESKSLATLLSRIAGKDGYAPMDNPKHAQPGTSDAVNTALPLTKGQIALWLHDQKTPGDAGYTVPMALRLAGSLDKDMLRAAFADLLKRHPVLTSVFTANGGMPQRIVQDGISYPIEELDLSGAPASVIENELHAFAGLPFDLTNGPLVRSLLIQEAADRHVLIICVHHIVFDGQSAMILIDDLMRLYEARLQGVRLPRPIGSSFDAFQRWQERLLTSERGTNIRAFWRDELEGHNELCLPGDWDADLECASKAGSHVLWIDKDTARRITEASTAHGATPAQFMMAAFVLILHRLTGSHDLLIGLPVLGRPDRSFDHTVGYFANLLPLRIRLSDQVSIRDLVRETRQTMLNALEHGDLPLSEMGEVSGTGRLLMPRVQFAFQSLVGPQNTDRGSLEVSVVDGIDQQGVQDLALEVYPGPEGMRCRFAYNARQFKSDTVSALADAYQKVLSTFLADPGGALVDVSLAGADDEVLTDWGHGGPPAPDEALIPAWRAQVRMAPDAPAVICGDTVLTNAALEQNAGDLAARLVDAGVQPGDVVASCLARSANSLVAVLATWWVGAVHMPLSPVQSSSRLDDMIADGAPVLALTDAKTASLLSIRQMRVDERTEISKATAGVLPTPVIQDPAAAAYILFTSGSSGRPKGVQVPHHALAHHIQAMANLFAVNDQDRVLQFVETSFDAAFEQWLTTLVRGATVVMRPEGLWSALDFAEAVQRWAVTVADLPPAFLDEVLRDLGRSDDWQLLQSLRTVVTGGEALTENTLSTWCDSPLADRALVNVYGPTETTIGSTAFVYRAQMDGPERRLPIGRPLPGENVFVLDVADQPLPAGLIGELAIGGVGLADGYIAAQNKQGGFSSGPGGKADRLYKTGDLARWRTDGQLEFLGRRDNQVNVRGFRVELAEVEAGLERIDGVLRAAVTVSDRKPDTTLQAYVTVSDPDLEPAAISRALKSSLPDYMWPSEIRVVTALPQTIAGKLDRQSLNGAPAPSVSIPEGPLSRIEKVLASLWAELLDCPSVPVTANIFELGAHSLLLIRFAGEIRSRLGAELSVAQLFQAPTVADQAVLIERAKGNRSSVVNLQAGSGPGLVLVHGGVGTLLCYRTLMKHLDPRFSILGLEMNRLDRWNSIPDAATAYLADLEFDQGQAPLHLAGWSSGGIVAWEMARQIERSGGELASLTLIDSYPPAVLSHIDNRIQPHDHEKALLAGFARDMGLAAELPSAEPKGAPEKYLQNMAENTGEDFQVLLTLFNNYKHIAKAVDGYTPEPVSVAASVFHAEGAEISSAMRGWPAEAGVLDIQPVPGGHLSMLEGEHSRFLANLLNGKLTTAHD
ncbi:non-ribosomal peptide synthetase [Labrenzia sp. PHM005]|uniref:non-ribosomal peptide synthetase n=1 Tax=Labrenzia sp. PHM005 TaxID=2590016 RepID=UPI00143D0559|nr:non-ribosomal peptide synthetase [Labrenzia sp. PHM005]